MAGIDKTYLKEKEYAQVVEWCEKLGEVRHPLSGFTFVPMNSIYYPTKEERDEIRNEIREEQKNKGHEYDEELVLWNTPTWFDYWLVKECPFDFIQNRICTQYSSDWVESVKNGTSEYDTYKRNGLGKNLDVKIIKKPSFNCRTGIYFPYYKKKLQRWFINVDDDENNWKYAGIEPHEHELWDYNEYLDEFVNHYKELKPWTSSCYLGLRKGDMCFKTILRKLRKWNLPAGLTIRIAGLWQGQEWEMVTVEHKNKKRK